MSTTVSASSKSHPLSYAERAKKAQTTRTEVSGSAPNRIPPSSSASSSSSPSTLNGAITRSSSSTSTDNSSSLFAKSDRRPSSPNPSTTPQAYVTATQSTIDIRTPIESSPKQVAGAGASNSTPKQAANIWDRRKELLASSRSDPQSLTPSTSSPSGPPRPQSIMTKPGAANSEKNSAVSSFAELSSGSRSTSLGLRTDEAPVTQPSKSSRTMQPPPASDTEAWPEVGKSSQPEHQPISSSSQAIAKNVSDETASVGGLGKKGEKPKWVPIPPEELQATADAILSKNSRPSSRKHSKARGAPRSNEGLNTSLPQTRTNSGRNSVSHSVSNSRVQSRSASRHSSPRNSRGRRLPGEEGTNLKPNGARTPTSNRAPSRSPQAGSPLLLNPSGPSLQSQQSSVNGLNIVPPVPPHFPVPQGPSLSPHHYTMYPHRGIPMGPPHIPPGASYPFPLPAISSQNGSPSMQTRPIPPAHYPHVPPYPPVYPGYGPFDYPVPTPPFWNLGALSHSGQNSPTYPPVVQTSYPSSDVYLVNGHLGAEATAVEGATSASEPSNLEFLPADPPTTLTADRSVTFGTIGIPSPGLTDEQPAESSTATSTEVIESSFTKFSIGVSPDELLHPRRSKNRSNRGGRSRAGTIEDVATPVKQAIDAKDASDKEAEGNPKGVEAVLSKWEFGTASSFGVDSSADNPDHVIETQLPISADASPGRSPLELPVPVPIPVSIPAPALVPTHMIHPQHRPSSGGLGTEFQVQNFGYGFGRPVHPAEIVKQEQSQRAQRDMDERIAKAQRRSQEAPVENGPPGSGKGRRGPERGGNGGKRGGRGGGPGPMNGVGSGVAKGQGGQSRSHHRSNSFHGPQPPRQQQPSISVTPPQFQQPISHASDSPTGFFISARHPPHPPPYLTTPFDTFSPIVPPIPAPAPGPGQHVSPPVPTPMTALSFPLDPTRYYLLGQLEYYLSPQNMAQDFFLRQRMDSRGWIPIPLIASFNRVRRLTMDANLVKEVLLLSLTVEVRDNWVRMRDWKRFVLPDAAVSVVEGVIQSASQASPHDGAERFVSQHGDAADTSHQGDGEEGDEDDEEDDVVFVMGKESGLSI
ncbi:hypothetical protein FA15DRAFT_711075 [Coprinopsis marcescibilis]|uniref:HTH La-type RNA-binding domain-containing protein n=1 Tax=Coprinopsis marcescibilis TaxID=230819 RepID=A0A5C3KAS1_COPMA|nr:hypothetical protein FA15DRAFT_711075 [Coprinopsis marcescibilis]